MSSHGASPPAPPIPPEAASVSTIEIQTLLEKMHIDIDMDMDPDLIIEILLRLPVKSILRFKAVCKFWRSLISDPLFASLHFQRATPTLLFATPDAFQGFAPTPVSREPYAIRTMDLEGPLRSDRVSEPINCHFLSNYDLTSSDNICIQGSCRGFLLITWDNSPDLFNESLYLWNPSTHVHKPIPSSPVVDTNFLNYLYGFGYDSSRDDYLVVRLLLTVGGDDLPDVPDVQFFSLRANMWKYTEGVDLPPLTEMFHTTGVFFNEAIHWVVANSYWVNDIMTLYIIAFDLMENRLIEIPGPHDLLTSCFNLLVHERFLSLTVLHRLDTGDTCEIWVMKKYKVQTSWTKTLVLSLEEFHYPVCATKGGDIFTASGIKLIKYSDEGVVQGEQLEYQNHFGFINSVPMYTESMLSLPDVSD